MSFFNPEIPIKEKTVVKPPHPWQKRIKAAYTGKIKYAHNSIRNPQYPKKKEKEPYSDRVTFSVIGNRITKEFVYCVNLVKGMHKYRWKMFGAPIIRGVTSIEWPAVLHDLKVQHGGLAYCLKTQVAVLINGKFLGGDAELKEFIETKYIYHICPDYYNEGVGQFASFIRSSGRACAYMHIAINDQHIGTLIFMLYSEIVPYTCENFLRLCIAKKGGYAGTPIHRIVSDGWIQCGGFGLKNTNDLNCENFIIPHDRRGVLCMANDGRHVECSTQFFVLLQPAPWMEFKYVAFGQLIEGEETLKKIESVPTWYESPKSSIIIYQAGIFNMDCHDFMINRGANEYIQGHIEDLNALGDALYAMLLERVFLELELRRLELLRKELEIAGEGEEEEKPEKNIHATQRFNRKKEEIQRQIEKSQMEALRITSAVTKEPDKSQARRGTSVVSKHSQKSQVIADDVNNDFDVDEYAYEPEEDTYKHYSISIAASVTIVVKPERPFYIPLTDVPYPGEVDSTYDLKKFLKGDYCLENDLETSISKNKKGLAEFSSALFHIDDGDDEEEDRDDEVSLDSDDEREIRRYLKLYADSVSFSGDTIKNIAKNYGKFNIFEDAGKSELITDEILRRMRVAAEARHRQSRDKKVSINVPAEGESHIKIKRRQTGFVRPEDLERIRSIHDNYGESEEDLGSVVEMPRKVRITAPPSGPYLPRQSRRPTGFVNIKLPESDSDMQVGRQSVLTRLYDDIRSSVDESGPTLKDFKPMSESRGKNLLLLTYSTNSQIRHEDGREKFLRPSLAADGSFEHLLNMQHGKSVTRKISSDYVKTIDQMERKQDKTGTSIRSIEFAKSRPTMSVVDYQMKNQKYQDELKSKSQMIKVDEDYDGLRLPGDTPLYCLSLVDTK